MDRLKKTWRTVLVCLILALATLSVFWPLRDADFLFFDDPSYVTVNPHVTSGLTWDNVKWAFTAGHASNWHPLTWLSHMLDVSLFGLNAGRHHVTNFLFHTVNSVLLLLVLKRMTAAFWPSTFVAALFALHPLHVESVAWVAERKDVLSAFFFMLTLMAYTKYTEEFRVLSLKFKVPGRRKAAQASSAQERGVKFNRWYFLALFLFALGLMSKPMLVTLPFVLLLLDFWPLGRIQEFRVSSLKFKASGLLGLLVEKIPFFALTIISCIVTMRVQTEAMIDPSALPLHARLGNAALACVAYLARTFWPVKLSVFYPYPVELDSALALGAIALIVAVTALCVVVFRRWPFAPVGWFWYLGMLVPVIGLVQVGSQARADRYTYLPLIGIFILDSWAIAALANELPPRIRPALAAAALAILVALGVTAHQRVLQWHNSESLYRDAVAVKSDNYAALGGMGLVELRRNNPAAGMQWLTNALELARPHGAADGIEYYIGAALQMQGKGLEALPHLEASRVLSEQKPDRDYRIGLSLLEAGRIAEAELHLQEALQARPDNAEFQLGMAALLHQKGEDDKADKMFREVLTTNPDLGSAHQSYADFLVLRNRLAEAEPQFAKAVKLLPKSAPVRRAYASVLNQLGKLPEAIQQLEDALKLDPGNTTVNFDLAELLAQQGKTRDAIARYNRVIESDPKQIGALNNLAWVLATDPDDSIRNGPRAVELAERACQATDWKAPFLIGTLAAAYAESGRYTEAASTAAKARDLARTNKLDEVAKKNDELRALYESGKPYREPK